LAQVWEETLANNLKEKFFIRGAQIDLDKIVSKDSYAESDHNLGLLIDRLVSLGVNTVFLQGFCDKDGSGNIRSLYFYNRTLPVEADFLSHAVNRIKVRGIKVFIWMPVLSFELPDARLNESLKVREMKDRQVGVTQSWYRRLSPFDDRSLAISRAIFRDLSAYVDFDGILFQDDAYLSDKEDFHPAALKKFRELHHLDLSGETLENDGLIKSPWIQLKTETLDRFLAELVKVIKTYPGLCPRN
jgi:biofilm PGA synthesis lipoprotein PgaB